MTKDSLVAASARDAPIDDLIDEPARPDRRVSFLKRLARSWHNRRVLGKIEQLDDHLLDDIGLTRSDLARARALPFDIDPFELLGSISRANRLHRACSRQATGASSRPSNGRSILAL